MAQDQQIQRDLQVLIQSRHDLEAKLQNEKGELSDRTIGEYSQQYGKLQRSLMTVFKSSSDEQERIGAMLEMIRIMENELVYLQNFVVEQSADNSVLASLVGRFLDTLSESNRSPMTPLEILYYRAVAALYAGDTASAAAGFRNACESDESDEANDIKYKSYVILGNISHDQQDFEQARQMHDRSLQYSQHSNVTAQALAFKALNCYALKNFDEALQLFEQSLELFDEGEPFFNSYFHRNALLFCGAIYSQRKEYGKAESFYRRVIDQVEPNSYDHFDALSQLGKICYSTNRMDDAAEFFKQAIETQTANANENEYIVDIYFWLARTQLKRSNGLEARRLLEKVASSDAKYERKSQAMELLQRVS
ncbi:MAG: tetratricopeptide repeat protein [Acidobacteriota bacterium]